MKRKNLKTGKRAPGLKRGKPVRVQRLVRQCWALKSKQFWTGGFRQYWVFPDRRVTRRYMESLRHSGKLVRVEILELPNAALCDPAHGDAGKPKTFMSKSKDAMPGSQQQVVLPIVGAEYHTKRGETLFVKRAWIHPQAGPHVAWVKLLCAREFIEPLAKFQKRIGQNDDSTTAGSLNQT